MKLHHPKKALVLVAWLLLTVCVSSALAQELRTARHPFPPPPVQWAAHGDCLYVLDARFLHQYSMSDLRLKQTLPLPEPETVSSTDSGGSGPPIPPPRMSLLAQGDDLYVLDFRSIHKYKLPSLDFVQTVILADPEEAAP